MSARHKVKVVLQDNAPPPQESIKKRGKRGDMLIRTPSLQQQHSGRQRVTMKNDSVLKTADKRGLSAAAVNKFASHNLQNVSQTKLRQFSKKMSDHKMQPANYSSLKEQPNKPQLAELLQENESLVNKVKFGHKSKKHRERRQLIYLTKGNNHQILREMFVIKGGLAQTQAREHATICWLQSIRQKEVGFQSLMSAHEEYLPDIAKYKQEYPDPIYNYLQGQSQLTNKEKLYKNMLKSNPDSIGDYIPKSFIVDFRQEQIMVEESLIEFITYYIKKDQNKDRKFKSITIKNYFADFTIPQKVMTRLVDKMHMEKLTPNQEESTEEKTSRVQDIKDRLWILKPSSLNRGRGIHLFSTIKQLCKLLSETPFDISVKMYSENLKPKTYIIQQYIERPLLIDGYKFDMRMWVLLQVVKTTGKKALKTYLFVHGYSRLASIKYQMGTKDEKEQNNDKESSQKNSPKKQKKSYMNNQYIHLTNNAVQKDAKQYGQYCEGNQLSIEDTVKYFQEKDKDCSLTFEKVIQSMKNIIEKSVDCVKQKLITNNTAKTFQLLGYDFLFDQDYKLWLIQINCNPCLQESSQLLGKLLRQMLGGLIFLSELGPSSKNQGNAEGWIELNP